jgi:hypothetical protein
MRPRVTQVTLVKEGQPIFSDEAFSIAIEDEAGGEFVTVLCHMRDYGKIAINPDEWEALRGAIDSMVRECRDDPHA